MANQPNQNDISDVQTQSAQNPNVSAKVLPIRGEKRIVPVPLNPATVNQAFQQDYTKSGKQPPTYKKNTGRTSLVQQSDFYVHASMAPYIDYVQVRVLNRGFGANGQADPTQNAVYRFLINPSQVRVNRQTLDAQAFARSGWQFGVWGEDSLQINLTGKTAGQYFSFGITDRYQEFSQSYRNLEQLVFVFENNGYWFEGESAAEGPLAADYARRRIKMHQDIELTVGNFIWYGMFESLELTQNADEPWLMEFNLSFIAWKERFRPSSPYQNQLRNDVQRGNSYSAYAATQAPNNTTQQNTPVQSNPNSSTPPVGTPAPSTPNVNPNSAAVSVAVNAYTLQPVAPNIFDVTPMGVPGTNTTLLTAGGPTPTSTSKP